MAKNDAIRPFLTATLGSVSTDPYSAWQVQVRNETIPLEDGDMFPSWDSQLKFRLRRVFCLNPSSLAAEAGLIGVKPSFALVIRLVTGNGLTSVIADMRDIPESNEAVEVESSFNPDSSALSQNITLVSCLVLKDFDGSPQELAPDFRGAVLWSERWTVKIEGGRSRLPSETVSFSDYFRNQDCENALLRVVIADDPSLDFNQGVCVYLNADNPAFVASLQKADPGAKAFFNDTVIRQMIAYGLSDSYRESRGGFPDGSIGHQLTVLLRSIFGRETPEMISAIRLDNPGLYEARIQSWAKIHTLWQEAVNP
ncbi:MAG: hypothetical protein RLZZ445_1935 [Pseudomonadota bacterium]|jgi:hypothetical protein